MKTTTAQIEGIDLDQIIYALKRQNSRENVELLMHFLAKYWIAQQSIENLMTVAKGDHIQAQAKELIEQTPKVESYEICTVSIAHLAEDDRCSSEVWTMEGKYGYLLRIPCEGEETEEEILETMPSLIPIMQWAIKLNFSYVLFDRDGATVSELPIYS